MMELYIISLIIILIFQSLGLKLIGNVFGTIAIGFVGTILIFLILPSVYIVVGMNLIFFFVFLVSISIVGLIGYLIFKNFLGFVTFETIYVIILILIINMTDIILLVRGGV